MNDDSAEWMANLKASGQLWPDPLEERGGDGDEARMGMVMLPMATNDEGQQVLGTCSPELTVTLSALLSRLQRIHDDTIDGIAKYRVELCMDEVRKILRGEP